MMARGGAAAVSRGVWTWRVPTVLWRRQQMEIGRGKRRGTGRLSAIPRANTLDQMGPFPRSGVTLTHHINRKLHSL